MTSVLWGPQCPIQGCKMSSTCWNCGTLHVDLGQCLAWRHFVWVFSRMLRLWAACSLPLVSLSEYDWVTRKQDGLGWYFSGYTPYDSAVLSYRQRKIWLWYVCVLAPLPSTCPLSYSRQLSCSSVVCIRFAPSLFLPLSLLGYQLCCCWEMTCQVRTVVAVLHVCVWVLLAAVDWVPVLTTLALLYILMVNTFLCAHVVSGPVSMDKWL